jgi:regulation of enolase protein 1 (concanavalin A-like superfamily)
MAGLTTNGWSEWSTLPQLPTNPATVRMRVTRDGSTLFVDYSLDGEPYTILKLCALPDATDLMVGRYAASPVGSGFTARFHAFSLTKTESK